MISLNLNEILTSLNPVVGSGDSILIDPDFNRELSSGFSGESSGMGQCFDLRCPKSINFSGSGEYSGASGDIPLFTAEDCATLSDGNYSMSACGHQFLSCSNGQHSVMDCPSGHVYNWAIDACDLPNNLGCDLEGSGIDASGGKSVLNCLV